MAVCRNAASLFAAAALFAACSGGGSTSSQIPAGATHPPHSAASCPPPSPLPTPVPAWLAYPPNGSANVSTNIGEIVEKGAGLPNTLGIAVSSAAGPIPLGTPTTAPSPFPSPFATPDPNSGLPNLNQPYVAVPLPTLSPSTTYSVSDVYTGWDDNRPNAAHRSFSSWARSRQDRDLTPRVRGYAPFDTSG